MQLQPIAPVYQCSTNLKGWQTSMLWGWRVRRAHGRPECAAVYLCAISSAMMAVNLAVAGAKEYSVCCSCVRHLLLCLL